MGRACTAEQKVCLWVCFLLFARSLAPPRNRKGGLGVGHVDPIRRALRSELNGFSSLVLDLAVHTSRNTHRAGLEFLHARNSQAQGDHELARHLLHPALLRGPRDLKHECM